MDSNTIYRYPAEECFDFDDFFLGPPFWLTSNEDENVSTFRAIDIFESWMSQQPTEDIPQPTANLVLDFLFFVHRRYSIHLDPETAQNFFMSYRQEMSEQIEPDLYLFKQPLEEFTYIV